jgi:sensor domain CHASE-containing protein
MKQGSKIVSCVVLLAVTFVMVQTASLIGLFRISFKTIEKIVARKNLRSCINSLQEELNHLNDLAFEWSAWDDTGLFIEEKKPQYIGENMSENTLREKNLDIICILDNRGQIAWSRFVKSSGNESLKINLEMFSQKNLQNNKVLWNHKDVNSSVTGYCATESGILLLGSRPVTNNTNSPPIHGTIIIGRFITDRMIASIAKQTCLDFQWWNLHSDYTRQAMHKCLSQITPDSPVYIEFELNTAAAYTVLQDINKNDAVLVKFLMTDDLASCRDELLIKSISVFFAEGFLFLVCLAFATNRVCRKYSFKSACPPDWLPDTTDLSLEPAPESETADETAVMASEK